MLHDIFRHLCPFAGGQALDWLKDFWGRQKRILRHRRVNPLQNTKSVARDIFVRVLHSGLALERQCDDLFQPVLRAGLKNQNEAMFMRVGGA
jgi:hypothetical protein